MKILFATILLFTTSAYAGSTNLSKVVCTTAKVIEGKKNSRFSFVVENLNEENAKLNYWTKTDDEDPVKMSPNNSVLMLNDNWNIRRSDNGIQLNSDGDGCQYTTVVLYKDSDYQAGYARVEDGGCGAAGVPLYTTVSCQVSPYNP